VLSRRWCKEQQDGAYASMSSVSYVPRLYCSSFVAVEALHSLDIDELQHGLGCCYVLFFSKWQCWTTEASSFPARVWSIKFWSLLEIFLLRLRTVCCLNYSNHAW